MAFVTKSEFSIYPGVEIGRSSKRPAFDGPRAPVPGSAHTQYRRAVQPFIQTRPARRRAKLAKKSCSRQGLNGMRAPS
ncbi:hypothetical protein BC2230_40269 [Burkholderia cepacia]